MFTGNPSSKQSQDWIEQNHNKEKEPEAKSDVHLQIHGQLPTKSKKRVFIKPGLNLMQEATFNCKIIIKNKNKNKNKEKRQAYFFI